MGKKKVKPNAFSEFMHEFIAKQRAAGNLYPKEQWSEAAKPHWEKMSDAEKAKYKERASGKPGTAVQTTTYTSQGIPVAEYDRIEREKHLNQKYMEQSVRRFVRFGFEKNEMKTKPLYFMMAEYFYKHKDFYAPAEIAIGKFTFANGLDKMYHSYVNPGEVLTGYAYEAKFHSEQTHHLPPPPDAMGERNYEKIYKKILDVLGIKTHNVFPKGDERRPCIFVRRDNIEMVTDILKTLSGEIQWQNQFDIFELEWFFNELKNEVDLDPENPQRRIPISVTDYFIEQDKFDLSPNISCQFHEDEDATKHCAKSYPYRWYYLLADHIAAKIGVDLVPGINLPGNVLLKNEEHSD